MTASPLMTTSEALPVAPRMAMLVRFCGTYRVPVRLYVPALMRMVWPDCRLATAFWSWLTVETVTTVAVGAGSAGGLVVLGKTWLDGVLTVTAAVAVAVRPSASLTV